MKELAEIQKNLKVPKLQYNSFGKYNYRNCEDILEAVKPLLGDSVLTIEDDIQLKGERIYVKATAIFTAGDKSISVSAFAREALTKKGMDEAQITGAASSYARKYALNGLFLIDDTKDSDSQDNSQKQQSKPATPEEIGNALDDSNERKVKSLISTMTQESINALPKFLNEAQNAKLYALMGWGQ